MPRRTKRRVRQRGGIAPLAILFGLQAIKPITRIDQLLGVTEKRDKVRGTLNKTPIGRFFVSAANTLKKFGFGHRKRRNYRRLK